MVGNWGDVLTVSSISPTALNSFNTVSTSASFADLFIRPPNLRCIDFILGGVGMMNAVCPQCWSCTRR